MTFLRQIQNDKGFTLTETVIVLFILTIMISSLIANFHQIHSNRVIQQFLTQLENDILLTQHIVLTERRKVGIVFTPSNRYFATKSVFSGEKYFERNFPDEIRLDTTAVDGSLTFNAIGNASRSGSILVYFKTSIYKVTIYLGKGRLHVEKL